MKAKRILASVVALVVLLMGMTVMASAEGAAVEVATYDDLVAAVANGGEIKLTDDISYHNSYTNNKSIKIATGTNVTLDLNGHSLGQYVWDNGASVAAVIVREGATLTVKDTSVAQTGKIHACNTAFQLQGTLYLQSGTISIENPSNYDVNPATGWAYGVWFYMASDSSPAPAFYMTGGAITICDELLTAHKESNFANAVAFDDSVGGIDACYDDAIVEITGGTLNSNIIVGKNAQNITVPDNVEVVYYAPVATVGGVAYTSLADAVYYADNNDTITILSNIELAETIVIDKPVKIDGADFKITTSAKKLFEVFADFSVSNLKMESTHKDGRCVDTRVDNITVSIDNCELLSSGSTWGQTITIGGSAEGGLTVNITDSKVISNKYTAIIMFVPAELTIENSEISGYAAIYAKGINGNTTGSVITVKGSDLISKNVYQDPSNSFATIVIEDDGVTVTVDADSSITAESASIDAHQAALSLLNKDSSATIDCPITTIGNITSVLSMVNGEGASVTVTNEDVKAALKAEGYIVADNGTVTVPEVRWVEDTDAGFYIEEGTKYGLLRFLFSVSIDEKDITGSGIKYIKTSQMAAGKDATESHDVTGGTSSVFYGDINGILPEADGLSLAAIAYVTTESGTYWSEAIEATVDMTSQQFTDYVAGGAQ